MKASIRSIALNNISPEFHKKLFLPYISFAKSMLGFSMNFFTFELCSCG